jgi:hypothetical protein
MLYVYTMVLYIQIVCKIGGSATMQCIVVIVDAQLWDVTVRLR